MCSLVRGRPAAAGLCVLLPLPIPSFPHSPVSKPDWHHTIAEGSMDPPEATSPYRRPLMEIAKPLPPVVETRPDADDVCALCLDAEGVLMPKHDKCSLCYHAACLSLYPHANYKCPCGCSYQRWNQRWVRAMARTLVYVPENIVEGGGLFPYALAYRALEMLEPMIAADTIGAPLCVSLWSETKATVLWGSVLVSVYLDPSSVEGVTWLMINRRGL